MVAVLFFVFPTCTVTYGSLVPGKYGKPGTTKNAIFHAFETVHEKLRTLMMMINNDTITMWNKRLIALTDQPISSPSSKSSSFSCQDKPIQSTNTLPGPPTTP